MPNQDQLEALANRMMDVGTTRRNISKELEPRLYNPISILDHGHLYVVDYMGNDASIVEAARVSYGQGTKKISEDHGLIHYLLRHRHSTPFEQCTIKYHIKLPIFVARQLVRHRTQALNEVSARYSVLPNEFYIPEPAQMAAQSKVNRQGRGDILTAKEAELVRQILEGQCDRAYDTYMMLLSKTDEILDTEYGSPIDEATRRLEESGLEGYTKFIDHVVDPESHYPGLARELSRMVLPLNIYTEWYATTSLHNLFHMLELRLDKHAQWEIRVYANALWEMVKLWVPMAAEAFEDVVLNGVHFTGKQLEIIKAAFDSIMEGIDPDVISAVYIQTRIGQEWQGKYPDRKREFSELLEKLERIGL